MDGHFLGDTYLWSTDVFILDSSPDCELSADRLPDWSVCVEGCGPGWRLRPRRPGRSPLPEEQALAVSEGLAQTEEGWGVCTGGAASMPGGLLPGLLCSPVPHFFELASTTLTPWLTPQCPRDSNSLLESLSPWVQLSRGAASTFVFASLVPDGHWGLRLACPSVWLGFWPRPRPWLSLLMLQAVKAGSWVFSCSPRHLPWGWQVV